MAPFTQTSSQRIAHILLAGRRWVVIAMLLALHAALISPPGEIFQRVWLLVHFGLFLLWQPFFATESELDIPSVAILLGVTAVILYFVAGWMVVMWLLLLLGILGGRVFTVKAAPRNRFYLVAFAYVLSVLLLWGVPSLIMGEEEVPDNVALFVRHVLPFMLAALMVLPLPDDDDRGQVFDFFYAVLVFQLCVVLVLGSIVMMRFTDENYVNSVLLTVMGFGLALFIFAVLWNPMRGYGGLRTYFSRYLMSVGMPFELWMRRIAELGEVEHDPRRFLEAALAEIAEFPWMRGGRWKSPDGEGSFGEKSAFASNYSHQDLEIEFYTAIELSPALFLHMRLLAQVVGEFYEGKRRESALRHHAYLQAVHETGARLTHDVKNLLQSLYAITSMVPRENNPADGYSNLLQRQLPQLARRLQATLDKLRSPEVPTRDLPMRAGAWWADLERRLGGPDIAFGASIKDDLPVPSTLFDSFAENVIDNARAKALREPGIRISVRFALSRHELELAITDDGSAIPDSASQRLFREPIERNSGLGIGLYHVARMAEQSGYGVRVAANRDGEVRIVLARRDERDVSIPWKG
ncbi:MAG: ATP-binding protein [Usitatibacter sp.]